MSAAAAPGRSPGGRGDDIVHGRRGGARLRPGRRRLLAELLPRLAIAWPDHGALAAPLALFPESAREALWLEIGFGAGEHMAAQAMAHPHTALIGCEPFRNGVARLLSAVVEQGLDNIRIFTGHGGSLVACLPEGCLERVFILFPDPWPKTRHHKRRLIQPAFLDDLARTMADGAELRIATDHQGYCGWILARLLGHPAFAWGTRAPGDWRRRPPGWPPTRYEAKALAVGARCAYLRFLRRRRQRRP